MGRTMTWEEAKNQTAYDLLQVAAHNNGPFVITLEDGAAFTLEQKQPKKKPLGEELVLEPLPQLQGFVPEGWKDAIYDDYH